MQQHQARSGSQARLTSLFVVASAIACSGQDVVIGPSEILEPLMSVDPTGPVTFMFGGTITRIDATPPPPFDGVVASDPWSLTYTFDLSAADVDGRSTAGQYRDLVTHMRLVIGSQSVEGTPGIAQLGDIASSIFVNLNTGFADYGATAGLPDASAYTLVALSDDDAAVLSSDAVPTDLPVPLENHFPSYRTFTLRQPGSSALFLLGTVESFTATVSDPGHTPSGSDVVVAPEDETTGEASPVVVTFSEVANAGETTVTSGTVGQGTGPPAPGNFRLGSPPTYYDIQTTADATPPITVCISWEEGTYNNESQLKILHFENDAWQNVTLPGYPDTAANQICGSVSSLSPFLVAEENAAPVVTDLSLPEDPIPLGQSVEVFATFTDANPGDVHHAVIDWGDDTSSSGAVSESGGAGTVNGVHTYAAAGVYMVSMTVSDGDLADTRTSASSIPAYVVVYDASAGFVTGGGWIMSPAGAFTPDPAVDGKASFGFVAKYRPGATVPDGNTDFVFRAGDFRFRSTNYEWLVVAGSRAQFKGEGSINDSLTPYGFMLTAMDGADAGDPDLLRLKVWDPITDEIIYDNQSGADDSSSAGTVLGGGSIVVHRK